MNTPIEELIIELKGLKPFADKKGFHQYASSMGDAIGKANYYLEKERQVIIDAANTSMQEFTLDYACEFNDGKDYFNKNFEQ